MMTEGSKIAFRQLMVRLGLQKYAPEFDVYEDLQTAWELVKRRGAKKSVIKGDAFAGGKCVFLPEDEAEARSIIDALAGGACGGAGRRGLIEERIPVLYERSQFDGSNGSTLCSLGLYQDFKRRLDGDQGPNTGSLGARTVRPPNREVAYKLQEVAHQIIWGLAREGHPYRGVSYLGWLFASDSDFKLSEMNCRFGGGETEVLVHATSGGFLEMCFAMASGTRFKRTSLHTDVDALCVMLASAEYPDESQRDDPIAGLPEAESLGVKIFHAAAGDRDGALTTAKKGRILAITESGKDRAEIANRVYRAAECINFPGKHFRKDPVCNW